jgi:phosphate transport system protein
MPRRAFQAELAALRTDVTDLGAAVADRLRTAVDALGRGNVTLAEELLTDPGADGRDVGERARELERDCVRLHALQQPVASDLRFVAASFKIVGDLARVGTIATDLARYTVDAEPEVFPEVDVRSIETRVVDLFSDAVDVYAVADPDPDACRAVAARDDDVDAMVAAAGDAVVRDLVTADRVDTDADVERLLADVRRLFLTLRDLERVGDHAVFVAGRSLYAAENDDSLLV